jgi:hypothetical protein
MSQASGSSDESIGRPEEWREGRYQRTGTSPKQTVVTPPRTKPASNDPVSTPVTQRDYEHPSQTP